MRTYIVYVEDIGLVAIVHNLREAVDMMFIWSMYGHQPFFEVESN